MNDSGARSPGERAMPDHVIQPGLPASLRAEMRGEIALLRLSRPEKRNSVDDEMVHGIELFFNRLPEGTRAVVIHGEGEHFCAGLDLSAITATDASAGVFHSRAWHRAFARIEHGDVPVVCVLHGAVVGGGLELAAATHIRVAETSTYYALPEGSRGIFVGGGGAVRVPQLIGVARMMDMMLTGRTYGAEEGQAMGLSQYLAAPGAGLAKGIELAQRIAANTPMTNFALIHALPRIARADPETGLLMEALMASVAAADEAAKERLRAFLEKRAAKVVHS
jgi:enoyl-CoA hydratase/carnithine racemase